MCTSNGNPWNLLAMFRFGNRVPCSQQCTSFLESRFHLELNFTLVCKGLYNCISTKTFSVWYHHGLQVKYLLLNNQLNDGLNVDMSNGTR